MKYNKNEVTGKMRDRIILQNVNRSRSLTGFASESWADVATIWAFAESKLPGSNETIIEGKNTAKNICDFTIRYISSITEESRVVFKNKIYQVKNIKISHDRRFISFQGVYYDSYSTVIGLQLCSASLLAQSSLSAALMRVIKYQASLNAFGSVSADINFVQKVASSLNANALLSGDINFVQKAQASLLTLASVTGNITIPKTFNASLLATGTTTANLTVTSSSSLLLDLYPNAAAAYSLRKLRTAYTGSAIRVRSSTSGAEGDVSFDVNNTISASSTVTVTAVGTSGLSIGQQVTFSTFWNAGGSNQNVFVTTWYDQSGNARNATQTTQANQPQIVSSGIVITLNNKSSIEYTSSVNMNLSVPNSTSLFNFLHNGTSSNLIHVGSVGGISTTRIIIRNALGSATVGFFIYRDLGDKIATQINYQASGSVNTLNVSLNNSYLLNKQNLLFTSFDADNATASNRSIMYVNNGNAINLNSALNPTSTANSTNNLIFGDGFFGNFVGKYQEIIIYDNDNNSNRSGISTNINTHYAIY